ncbi:MAG: hypothetical protein IT437_03125 [Phycisphaerales bacterium]|nr:hypothetical protein [Phycisphaerales bacterium]
MRLVIRPDQDPQREIDVTHRLVAAIAAEIWEACGGNDELNWIEAEAHLRRIVGQARAQAREPRVNGGGRIGPDAQTAGGWPVRGDGAHPGRPEEAGRPSRRTGPKRTSARRAAARLW